MNKIIWILLIPVILALSVWIFLEIFVKPVIISPNLPLQEPLTLSPASPLVIRFNHPIHSLIQGQLTPPLEGEWHLARSRFSLLPDTLVFSPKTNPPADTEFLVTLKQILPVGWLNLKKQIQTIAFVFKTRPDAVTALPTNPEPSAHPTLTPTPVPTLPGAWVNLPVPQYFQHHTFTCYSVAAKMALAYRGVEIDEIDFLSEIGFESVKRNYATNVWGNPNKGIVGAISGSRGGGYGVHWGPVAKAINRYRPAEVKENWNLPDLLAKVRDGSPVMVWWVNGVWPAKDISWNTPSDGKVYTVNGMHVEVVTGFEGPADNPKVIFTNDPWRGKRRYHPDTFSHLWQWFGNTAIVVN